MEYDNLRPILEEILINYKTYKAEEAFYLIATSIFDDPLKKICYRLNPIPRVSSEIEINPGPPKPNSSTYIRTAVNIAGKEKEHLDFVPYDDSTNKAFYSTDLEVYKTNPFNQIHHQEEFILNKQLYEYLILCVIKVFSLREDWMKASSFLADQLGKNRRLMMQIFNETIEKYVNCEEEEKFKKQDFKNNFCQICLRYACATHFFDENFEAEGETVNENDAKIKEQYREDIVPMIDPEKWKVSWWSNLKNIEKTGKWFQHYRCTDKNQCSRTTIIYKKPILNYQKQLLKICLKKGLNNPCAISLFSQTPCLVTASYLSLYESKYVKPLALAKIPRKIFYSCLFDYHPLLVNVIETHCKCKSECSVRNKCPCLIGEISGSTVISRKCCEKYCLCSLDCKQRFLGCNCKYGKCDGKNCVCAANLRECDPELCLFCNCGISNRAEYHPKRKNRFLCLNMRNQSRIIKKTATGQSSIPGAGLGLFVIENCDAGEYITEYTGEIIGETESERRAAIYDYKHHSFIFSLSPDTRWAIDSTYYGSKMRYVNHKSHNEHNTFAQVWNVKGQVKILLFASEKIAAGQELFFDYGYDTKEIKYNWLQEYEKKFRNRKK